MGKWRALTMVVILACGVFLARPAHTGFGDWLKGLHKAVSGGGQALSEDQIISGLKEALEVGTQNAVALVSKAGGYYQNPAIKIPLPGALQKTENLVRAAGFGDQLDAFEKSMNQAAEKASGQAKTIFWDAVKEMTISDAQRILQGADNEATLYFREKTYDRLSTAFKPIVRNAMFKVDVTAKFQVLHNNLKDLPFLGNMTLDLDDYVNRGALEGLFSVLADEEKKIRQDPSARVTELLKTVFGQGEK